MTALALAFDLGTGGCKAAVWSEDGTCVAETVLPYPTSRPAAGREEQRPADWWDAVVGTTRALADRVEGFSHRVVAIALSGQSLGMVLVDGRRQLLGATTPIWSDRRGAAHTGSVFERMPEADWYRLTGNGFGAALYPLFKLGAMRDEEPERFAAARSVIGAKDWINLRLTGEVATDHSAASGLGAYRLQEGRYDEGLLDAAGLDPDLLPAPRESHEAVGPLTADAAEALALRSGIPVFTGAIDNACMVLGSMGTAEGRISASLGSSSWITVASRTPVLDDDARPYVFRHAIPGFFISALSTFSSGTAFDWWRGLLAPGMDAAAVLAEAFAAPAGAGGVTFLPMLAGGTPLEGGPTARGAMLGAHLGTTRAELLRACVEGIAFALARSHARMRALSGSTEALLVAGGGARSASWNSLYSDVLGVPLFRTSVEQQAATLGAATIAFVGLGTWRWVDADAAHRVTERIEPSPDASDRYADARRRFDAAVASRPS